jgi:hypothetical protein
MTDQPPKKKRKLLIIDIGEDGKPIPFLEGIGTTHQQLKKYVTDLAAHFQYQGEIHPTIWKMVDDVLLSRTQEEANERINAASQHALAFFQGAGGPGR